VVSSEYVLLVPTYGGGNENQTVPRQVVQFLNIPENRQRIKGVVGLGNTNFGAHYCRAAEIVSAKTGTPLLYRVEITGTQDDVREVKNRMETLWSTVTTS
jgi:protein involved in ribonucleotide reduction